MVEETYTSHEELFFLPNGVAKTKYARGTYALEGDTVTITLNNNKVRYRGTMKGDRISGTGDGGLDSGPNDRFKWVATREK